ncbi:MAG TPA: hypothetical protein VGF24_25910 [Vicinamibacterales bacterium]|jgi:hypothetical protein
MAVDRYLKVVLTVIALELGWLVIKDATVTVSAQRGQPAPMPVVISGVELPQREALPVTLTGNNAVVRVVSERPLQLEQPIIIQNDRPLLVETASRPLLIQSVPASSSPLPGPGR